MNNRVALNSADMDFNVPAYQFTPEYQANNPLQTRSPWMIIKTGVWASKDEMIEAVEQAGHLFKNLPKIIIYTTGWILSDGEEEFEGVWTTVKELTGKESAKTWEIYEARDRMGFCDAPDEAVSHVRRAYDGVVSVYILSRPKAAKSALYVLGAVWDPDGSWVRAISADPETTWHGEIQLLVFRKRQKRVA